MTQDVNPNAITETTEITESKQTGAAARAARLKAKRNTNAQAQSEADAAAARAETSAPVGKKSRTVNAVPKSDTKGGKATKAVATKSAEAEALERARQQKAADKEAKAVAKKAADEKKAADKITKTAEIKAKTEAREKAAAERQEATKPVIMPGEFPSTEIIVPIAELRDLPELVGARPSLQLVNSIRERGVIEPIILARRNEDDTTYRIVGGRRRVMASVLAERAEIEARVYTVGDRIDSWFAGMTVHLNASRSDNVAADVQAIGALRKIHTVERIARELNIPVGTVKKRIKLLELLPEVQALLFSGAVPHTVIAEMAGLSEDKQRQLVALFNTAGKLSHLDVKAARGTARKAAGAALPMDELTDGPDGGDVERGSTTRGTRTALIPNTGDLVSDVLGFLNDAAALSGISFSLSPDGVISLTRDGQAVEFAGRGGAIPESTETTSDIAGEAPDAAEPEETSDASE